MRKINSFQETASTGRVVLDLGDGTVFDTSTHPKDTGWRAITTPVEGELTIRRIGKVVYAVAENVRPQATGDLVLMDVPIGFRPSGGKSPMSTAWEGSSIRRFQVRDFSPYSLVLMGLGTVNSYVHGQHWWLTDDAWPTTLPGTAA